MQRITIKQIAELANVSIGTVDRVLHNRNDVNKNTRERVLKICKEYDYQPNKIGKALLMQKEENVIAVVINHRTLNKYSSELRDGFEGYLKNVQDFKISFKFFELFENTVKEHIEILDKIKLGKYKGLIISPINSPEVVDKINEVSEQLNMPVLVCHSRAKGVNSIGFVGRDDVKEGRIAGNVLRKCVNEHIKLVVIIGNLRNVSRSYKYDGFIKYLEENNVSYEILEINEFEDRNVCHKEEIFATLDRCKGANALYIHPAKVEEGIAALKEYGKFKGVAFTFGSQSSLRDSILNQTLTFAIYEDPQMVGYHSAEAMCDYIIFNRNVIDKKYIQEGKIALEENC